MDREPLNLVGLLLVTLCVAVACFLFPHRVQSWAKRSVSMGITGKIPALQGYVSSPAYLFHVRAMGAFALLMFVLLALVAIS